MHDLWNSRMGRIAWKNSSVTYVHARLKVSLEIFKCLKLILEINKEINGWFREIRWLGFVDPKWLEKYVRSKKRHIELRWLCFKNEQCKLFGNFSANRVPKLTNEYIAEISAMRRTQRYIICSVNMLRSKTRYGPL